MTTLRELREGKQWSQAKLAALAGVSPGTVSKIERGSAMLAITKKALADALGVKPDEITNVVANRVGWRAG